MYGSLGSVFARNGIGAVIISYRLSPGVHHPAHIEDVAAAFAWTKRHIAEHGGRPDRIFVTGQSAGGHLAALLATNEKYLAAHGLKVGDIRGCMPISGIYVFPGNRMRRVLGDDPGAPEDASPVKHVTGKEPPFLVLYADGDFPTCDLMSEQLGRTLERAGVPVSVREIEGRNHISIMLRAMLSDQDEVSRALIAFVREHERGGAE
jgi:acetyl esterase/lipase